VKMSSLQVRDWTDSAAASCALTFWICAVCCFGRHCRQPGGQLRFIVRADEKLTAFRELESATRDLPPSLSVMD
jgi:hypothetical protein